MKDQWSSKILLTSVLLILAVPSILCAANITLRWQPNAEADLRGYYIYFGMQPRSYGPPINVDLVTNYTLEGLEDNTPYYFAVSAVDTSGNESGFSEEISRTTGISDTLSPTISINSPAIPSDGVLETDNAVLQISGIAQDDRGITQVTWQSGDTNDVAEGTANWVIPGVTLNEGLNTVTVTAADASGNTSSATIGISYTAPDTTPPAVVITSPVREESYTSAKTTITLSGTAGDDRGLRQVSWESSTGNRGVASGTESWTIDAIELFEGLNTITITATDLAGNSSSDHLTVVYSATDTAAPTVTIQMPTGRSRYLARTSTVSIGGAASDNIGIAKVEWRNSRGENGTCRGTDNWRTPGIKLDRRWNTITITAFDKAGNRDQKQLRVFRWR